MLFATAIFVVSLVLLILLFALKHFELRRGSVFAPALRGRADARALQLKTMLGRSSVEASRIPPFLLLVARATLHETALGFAHIARSLERQAHNVADMMSHKRGFERKEPRSEFLKQMNDHKNGGADVSDDEIIAD